MPLADVAAMDEGESGPPLVVLSSAPSIKLPTTGAPPKRKRCTITKVRTPTRPQPTARVPTPTPAQPKAEAPLSTGSNHASEHGVPVAEPEAPKEASRDFSPAKSVHETEAQHVEEHAAPPTVEGQQLPAPKSDVQIMNQSQELTL